MDLICTYCGELWSMDTVLHEAPADFIRAGGLITRCPSCPSDPPNHTTKTRERLAAVAALAEILGNDVDGLAGTLDDFGLLM